MQVFDGWGNLQTHLYSIEILGEVPIKYSILEKFFDNPDFRAALGNLARNFPDNIVPKKSVDLTALYMLK